ncbi:flagellar protein FlgN [Serpentinicella sp. ANB-PHB4]|uniref:flagellar protein FlgN n=1 Tax=Serpentinicella sp. ANB-PHB4 TaxID=3074076 RepID=UPI002866369D|nr:flagellar protein FlgN [Serpentinicella sp. ANB-PHB4]MDR5659770.1 flagellar protein FlgN [Serpentinicella sp. ANB-PHB4]
MRSIEQLKEALEKELELYEKVLELGESKVNIVVKGKVKELEDITKKEEQYVVNMGTFEKVRRSIFVNIASELQCREIESLSQLILILEERNYDDHELKTLDDLRNKLMSVIDKIKAANELNEKLIKQSLNYISVNKELLLSAENPGNQYGKKAEENEKKTNTSFLDVRV